MKTETNEKYLKALQDLKTVLEYSSSVNMSQFARTNGLSKNFPYIITRGKLVENMGGKGKSAKYKWNTISPNIKMAERIINECNGYGNKAMKKTRKKRGASYNTQSKYLKALNDLHKTLKYSGNISMRDFVTTHNISSNFSKELLCNDIIVNNGGAGRGANYKWIGEEPSIELANKLIGWINNINVKYRNEPTNKKQETPIVIESHKNRKVSILWGMFKFELNRKP